MELKVYMLILLRKWWVILSVFIITLTATIVFTFTRPKIYEATVTFVIVPDPSLAGSVVYGVDILSRQTEIGNTYAEIAVSRLVRQHVADDLGVSMADMAGFLIDATPLAGTNLLKITVQGRDPQNVQNLANAIGDKTVAYVEKLQGIYALNLLDAATLPYHPVGSDKKMQIALGAVFGLVLGCGLAFFLEYLQIPLFASCELNVLDEESGVYNRNFLMRRLNEEMARAERNAYPLSLAFIDVDRTGRIEALPSPQARRVMIRRAAAFLLHHVRKEDMVARSNGTVFAILLPDLREEEAARVMGELEIGINSTTFELEREGTKLELNSLSSVVSYQRNQLSSEEFFAQAQKSLHPSAVGDGSSHEQEFLAI
jgi:diguanylate cyclase (GGDEF)-like protein